MQLKAAARWAVAVLLGGSLGVAPFVRAEDRVEAATTAFYEAGGPLHMAVLHPEVGANVDLGDVVSLAAGWQADVVSGASVRVVDAPGDIDAITSATVLTDTRHVFRGAVGLASETARLSGGVSYGFESDYRSLAASVTAGTDLFDRNTHFELNYTKGWDSVCDLAQPNAAEAVERRPLPTSAGCFEKGRGRTTHALDVHSLQGALTQVLTPVLSVQLVSSVQLLHGFQSNPYRAIWIGHAAPQEHHPNERVRYAVGLGARLWLRPIGGALQLEGRAYRDTWDVRALSGELGYERGLGEHLRLRARGRYHAQTAAAFYSDDYALAPQGQFFTGDRELSKMQSLLAGIRADVLIPARADGRVLGVFDSASFVIKGDYLRFWFPDYHYGRLSVPNNQAVIASLALEMTF